jgi:hypothetical protein
MDEVFLHFQKKPAKGGCMRLEEEVILGGFPFAE